MAKSRATKKTADKAGIAKRLTESIPSGLGLRVGGTVLFMAIMWFTGNRMAGVIREYVSEQDRYSIPLQDVSLAERPMWIEADLMKEVADLAGLPEKLNTLDADLADRLHRAFALHPWIRKVISVEISHPAGVEVKLEYREPVALVMSAGVLQPIDKDGVVLPREISDESNTYMIIVGVVSTPTGPLGTKWEDTRVLAGALTAAAITPRHHKWGLSTIETRHYDGDRSSTSTLYLTSDTGTRVRWGRPPGTQFPAEVALEEKLKMIDEHVARHGRLDSPGSTQLLDISRLSQMSILPKTRFD